MEPSNTNGIEIANKPETNGSPVGKTHYGQNKHHFSNHNTAKPFRPADVPTNMHSYMPNNPQRMELPLRILVPTSTMGAVIGKGGVTIKQIIAETSTRIDVHRNHGQVPQEKIVSIYGSAANCSRALHKIMEIVRNEESVAKSNETEVSLRILAHNAHVGRVIGKNGATINAIMKDTATRIGVSNISWNYSQFLTERVITIQGELPDQIRAEQQISDILRLFYAKEILNASSVANGPLNSNGATNNPNIVRTPNDYAHPHLYTPNNNGDHMHARGPVHTNNPPHMYFGAPPQMGMPYMDPMFAPQGYMQEPYGQANHITASHNIAAVQLLGPLVTHALGGIAMAVTRISALDKKKEVAHVHIPQSAVGPIIGTGGSTIQKIIQVSSANLIKVRIFFYLNEIMTLIFLRFFLVPDHIQL
jgi:predicted RNA-binding protein YlqC (UPF0109 family)